MENAVEGVEGGNGNSFVMSSDPATDDLVETIEVCIEAIRSRSRTSSSVMLSAATRDLNARSLSPVSMEVVDEDGACVNNDGRLMSSKGLTGIAVIVAFEMLRARSLPLDCVTVACVAVELARDREVLSEFDRLVREGA